MSRFEANKEPSMEEILASIREIIAGDPRGARPQQTPQRTSPAPASQRGFMSRDSFLSSSAPYQRQEPAAKRAETYFRPIVPQNEPAAAPSRDPVSPGVTQRSLNDQAGQSRLTTGTPGVSPGSSDRPEKVDDAAKSAPNSGSGAALPKTSTSTRDADLLGSRAEGIEKQVRDDDDTAAGKSAAGKSSVAASVPLAAAPAKADAPSESNENNASPKVTAPEAEATVAPEPVDDANDPFSFDLGPSPFAARAATPNATQADKSADDIAASLIKVERGIADIRATVARDVASPFSGSAAPSSPATANAPVDLQPRREAIMVASVAATLGPNSTLEPLSASFDRPGPAFERPSAVSAPAASLAAAPEKLRAPSPLMAAPSPLMATPSQMADRALEDTVADLLRPMLKTWLAENMPKIVERALRREINERLLLTEKNAAE